MNHRYSAVLFTVLLTAAFAVGFFIKPTQSRAYARLGWQGEYFANPNFEGLPVVTATDETIEMNWFMDAPYKELPADYFSVRWTTTVDFAEGVYRFRVGADDGVRLSIDDKPVIDAFTIGAFRTLTRDVRITEGTHRLKVEYFEQTGLAGVLVDWSPIGNASEIVDLDTQSTEVVKPASPTEVPLAYIAASLLDVYAQPSPTAPRLAQVRLYQRYPVLAVSPDGQWYNIELDQGVTGWVEEKYVYYTESSSSEAVESVAQPDSVERLTGVATTRLKLRPHAGDGTTLVVIPSAATVQVLGRDESGRWVYVMWQRDALTSVEGWVFAPLVKVNGRLADLAIR